jgi:hypothetical protein
MALIAMQLRNTDLLEITSAAKCVAWSRKVPGKGAAEKKIILQIPVHCGQSFRRIADSIPVIADSFS